MSLSVQRVARMVAVLVTALLICTTFTYTANVTSSAYAANGCGPAGWRNKIVPETQFGANFKPACNAHDRCYSAGSRVARLSCDRYFRDAMNRACRDQAWWGFLSECAASVSTYYEAVRRLGRANYKGDGSKAASPV